MRLVQGHRGFDRKRCAAAVGALLLALAVGAAAASADRSSDARSASLCSASKSVAADIAGSTDTTNIAGSPTKLKAFWNTLETAEPSVLKASSGRMKTRLKHVFAFVNNVVADLNKVNWVYTGLLPYEKSLESQSQKVNPDIDAVRAYFRKTCKLNV